MITDYLFIGKENARTGAELAKALRCDPRDIGKAIERARRQGAPICASCDPEQPGYYIAANAEDLQRYCRSLNKRINEIQTTHAALVPIIDTLPPAEDD